MVVVGPSPAPKAYFPAPKKEMSEFQVSEISHTFFDGRQAEKSVFVSESLGKSCPIAQHVLRVRCQVDIRSTSENARFES